MRRCRVLTFFFKPFAPTFFLSSRYPHEAPLVLITNESLPPGLARKLMEAANVRAATMVGGINSNTVITPGDKITHRLERIPSRFTPNQERVYLVVRTHTIEKSGRVTLEKRSSVRLFRSRFADLSPPPPPPPPPASFPGGLFAWG